MKGLFDSHCHLDDAKFDTDRMDLIQALPAQGLDYCVSVGSDLQSSAFNAQLAKQYGHVYAACGIHPHVVKDAPTDWKEQLRALLQLPKVVALGEIGLDYYYNHSPRDVQQRFMSEQMDLALEMNLPVIIHVRDAHGDTIDLLRNRADRHAGGVIHCYSGSAESVQEYVRLGFMISFAGSVTFKTAHKLRLAAQAVPLESLLIETDSPYLTPVPFRGRRNDPAKVGYVCELLAELRGMASQQMADLTRNNAMRLFGVPKADLPAVFPLCFNSVK